jgi:Uma2 family endonuclease
MALAPSAQSVSADEYVRQERAATYKSEYYAGEMYPMPDAGPEHSLITANIIGELGNLLKGTDCAPYDSNLRLWVRKSGLYTYPDASVICGPAEFADERRDMVTNPAVIVEVLSDSTETYDRGNKFEHYRTLPSLREYVLVSQKAPLVDIFTRRDGAAWALTPVRGLEAIAPLESMGVELRLREIYDRIEFTDPAPLKRITG